MAKEYFNNHSEWKRFRNCQAEICETESFYILRSYRTIVACIDKNHDILYDFLRLVYGYTSTSCQHIAKFSHDYGSGKYGVRSRYIYRPV